MYFLDIDVDFLVDYTPHKKITTAKGLEELDKRSNIWLSPEDLVETIFEKGFSFELSKFYSFDDHKESFHVWKKNLMWLQSPPKSEATLIHIDYHHDLFGCMYSDLNRMDDNELGCANYLWYALKHNFFKEIIWIVPDLEKLRKVSGQIFFIHNLYNLHHHYCKSTATLNYTNYLGQRCETPFTVCQLDTLQSKDRPVSIVTVAQSKGFTPPKTFSYAHYINRLLSSSVSGNG
ncbi:hypothetical protein GGQ84_000630 [Desulfitispora alkaliphila]|uniref:hypothetical protein n=1 Tax=Desulfitispora alkaliphila TaxID=622674 RepID=UPI003D23C1CF